MANQIESLVMEFAYFLIAISSTSLLCAGLAFIIIDWLLTWWFAKLFKDIQLRDALAFVLSFVTAFGVFWVVLVNLFIMGASGA